MKTAAVILSLMGILLLTIIAYAVVDPCAWRRAEIHRSMPTVFIPEIVRAGPQPDTGIVLDEAGAEWATQRAKRRAEQAAATVDRHLARIGATGCLRELVYSRLGWSNE
jgi:hypothetical protein